VVAVDAWLAVDLARGDCAVRAAKGSPCTGEPTAEVRKFVDQLETVFANDTSCRNVTLDIRDDLLERSSQATSDSDWQLILDFAVGVDTQLWSMVPRTGNSVLNTGQGNPREIGHAICSVVKSQSHQARAFTGSKTAGRRVFAGS
jgi:hypothetical protein